MIKSHVELQKSTILIFTTFVKGKDLSITYFQIFPLQLSTLTVSVFTSNMQHSIQDLIIDHLSCE